jgi:hypothetical protein
MVVALSEKTIRPVSFILGYYLLLWFLPNSGSSSKNNIPICANEISPGLGCEPPPTNATADAV